MKTSTLFTALLATSLFAANAQAQSTAASGNGWASAQGSLQANTAAGEADIARSAQASSGAAQASSNASADASAQGNAAADMLAQRYAEAAGSVDAAADIVGDLRAGTRNHAAMAYGEIGTTLALASQLVADNEAANLDAAVDAVLNLRADGLGWGQVAQDLGYTLGDAVSTAHATGTHAAQGFKGTLSSASDPSVATQVGIEAAGSSVGVGVDARAAAADKSRIERPATELRTQGRINVGADVRPSLPVVRPLLGH